MTFHLHIKGQVQGVGFRPYVWRMACARGLHGWVNNAADGVHVLFNANPEQAERFTAELIGQAPEKARILEYRLEAVEAVHFESFEIVDSLVAAEPDLLITPDFALCPECLIELFSPGNRRQGYAFITCTVCGPRYSILHALPYDRERTAMSNFVQCPDCMAEYGAPEDRRFYSQTNSCPECGISLSYLPASGAKDPLGESLKVLEAGLIVAVKGIGGYLLLCDATDAGAVERLRLRKRRPAKPLAVLYPDLELLEADVYLRTEERALITGPEAPVVLLPVRPDPASGLVREQIAPELDAIGAMLPCAPVLALISRAFGKPLVATSGNPSGSPIVFREEDLALGLSDIADAMLGNNREIAVPQDDSVVQLSPFSAQTIWLRRSRGLAPYLPYPFPGKACTLSMGASLKSAFALGYKGKAYLSQYLGNLESYDTQRNFEHTLTHFLQLFRAQPELVAVDAHPDYFSSRLGERLAAEWQANLVQVQHHKAHFAAVLAEHRLMDSAEPVLGAIWDGTGYGDDGQVWGGEFLVWQAGKIDRAAHFAYYPVILGDKMALETRIPLLSLARDHASMLKAMEGLFSPQEWALYRRMLAAPALFTCSVGRAFDAVAAMLGLCRVNTFEGQAAMQVERLAAKYYRENGLGALAGRSPEDLTLSGALEAVYEALQKGHSKEYAAALFHGLLIESVGMAARQAGCHRIAFSGGVWQNALLCDLAKDRLSGTYQLYFPVLVPANDEGIAFGALMLSISGAIAPR